MKERKVKGIIMKCYRCGKMYAVRERLSDGRNCPTCGGEWIPEETCVMLLPQRGKTRRKNKGNARVSPPEVGISKK